MKNTMTTTRDNLVEILRENGGSENFDEIQENPRLKNHENHRFCRI